MPKKQAYKPKQIIKALQLSGGYVTKAAEKLNVTPQNIYEYIRRYPEILEAKEAIEESRLDMTESVLFELIENHDVASVIFYLKTKGKNRGYIERQEITGKDGERLTTPPNISKLSVEELNVLARLQEKMND